VGATEFTFALELFGPAVSAEMLFELVGRLLRQLGCDGVPGLADALETAAATAEDGCCSRLELCAGHGELRIVVSSSEGPIWSTSRSLA
jgi:hypothetical protein